MSNANNSSINNVGSKQPNSAERREKSRRTLQPGYTTPVPNTPSQKEVHAEQLAKERSDLKLINRAGDADRKAKQKRKKPSTSCPTSSGDHDTLVNSITASMTAKGVPTEDITRMLELLNATNFNNATLQENIAGVTEELKDTWKKSLLFDTPGEAATYLKSAIPLLIVLNWGRENSHITEPLKNHNGSLSPTGLGVLAMCRLILGETTAEISDLNVMNMLALSEHEPCPHPASFNEPPIELRRLSSLLAMQKVIVPSQSAMNVLSGSVENVAWLKEVKATDLIVIDTECVADGLGQPETQYFADKDLVKRFGCDPRNHLVAIRDAAAGSGAGGKSSGKKSGGGKAKPSQSLNCYCIVPGTRY